MSWTAAQSFCRGYGAQLVEIESSVENSIIEDEITKVGDQTWIGLTDAASEGAWKWASGRTPSYINWASSPQQPNDDGDCGRIYPDRDGWWDGPCDDSWLVLCQKLPPSRRIKDNLKYENNIHNNINNIIDNIDNTTNKNIEEKNINKDK